MRVEKKRATKLYSKIELLLGIDKRSLGVFRIALGSVMLFDLIVRARSITAHYTDKGIIPRSVLKGISENPVLLSLNMISGGTELQVIIFILACIFTIFFILGYKTRLASVICWVLMLSLHVRNPFLNNLGDWFLLNLLTWGMFLPLGTALSIDAKGRKNQTYEPQYILSVATMGILFQVIFLYFFSVYYKISPIWHTEGTAINYALILDRIVSSCGSTLLHLPENWLKQLTFGVLILERWGPLIAFSPIYSKICKILAATVFTVFHMGLAIFFELGIFPYVCITAWILFLPGDLWVAIHDFINRLKNKLVYIKSNLHFSRSSFNSTSVEKVYTPSWLETFLSAFLLWFVLSSNLLHSGLMGEGYYNYVYRFVEPLVNSLNLKQRWNMFSPHPSKRDGWFLFVGEQRDGTLINVINGEKVDWRRPSNIANSYINQRWRKNMEWAMDRWDPHAKQVGSYFFTNWNNTHRREEEIISLRVYFMMEYALNPLRSTPVERKLLCYVGSNSQVN